MLTRSGEHPLKFIAESMAHLYRTFSRLMTAQSTRVSSLKIYDSTSVRAVYV